MTESSFAENAEPMPRYAAHTSLLRVYSALNEVSLTFDHQEVVIQPDAEGVHAIVFDPSTGYPQYYTQFEIKNSQIEENFVNLIENLAENQLIALTSSLRSSLALSDRTQKALETLGSRITDLLPYSGNWGMIGRKGMVKGTAIESLSLEKPAECQINLPVASIALEITYPTLILAKTHQIYLDDYPLNFRRSETGIMKVIIFDELTGIPLKNEEIDIFSHEKSFFCQLIENLPHGRGVALMLQSHPDQPLPTKVIQCCRLLGSRLVENYPLGASWAMVGYKGTPIGSAIENLHPTSPDALILKVWLSPDLSPSAYWQPPQKLYAPNYHQDDAFGSAVAIEGQTAVMAAPLSDRELECNVGTVYVYQFNQGQWQHEASLSPHDMQHQLVFGKSVALNSNKVLIGAYLADSDWKMSTGAIYIFQKRGQTWQQSQKIQPYDLHPGDCFGCAIALEGSTALVGAYNGINLLRQPTGAVYVFKEISGVWQDQQKLQPKDLGNGDSFGHSVAISGEFAAVGAYLAQDQGLVYIFRQEKGIWQEYQTLKMPNLKRGDCFGYSVALEEDVLLIGAKNKAYRHKIGAGAVYVFHFLEGQWQWVQTLQPSDLRGYEHFGHSVALSGNLAIVGADQGNSAYQAHTGAVYTFQRDGNRWKPYFKLYGINGQEGDRFGYGVAIQDNLILVGAPSAEAFGRKGAGIVYPGHF